MTDLEIIDMHTHVQRDEAHGHEIRDYFLGPNLVKPGATNLGTLPELLEMNDQVGISGSNMLMFTWSGRYLRHGTYTLPDQEPDRSQAEAELRQRIARRVSDNNTWAASTCEQHPEISYFAGVNPVVMGAEGVVAEVERQRAQGAVGVKVVPSDMGVPGSDERLFPLYEHCTAHRIPVLTETGAHSPNSHPAGFADALKAFPGLTLVFAHCGHDREFGQGLDQQVLELAEQYDGVRGDTSLRLHEVADGSVTPEAMVAFLRKIGTERVMFGTNYLFCDVLPERPGHQPAPDHVDPRFTQVWKSVEVLKTLPLTDDERVAIAAGNFRRLKESGS